MKFGKLEDISQVDFSLPDDPSGTAEVLNKNKGSQNKLNVYFGCPAWSCKEWVGKYYPAKTKPADYLYHYSRQFNTIELNTTHYRIPKPETINRWKQSVPKGFTFCPKLPQSISHKKFFQGTQEALIQFAESVNKLERTLGTTFMQLPPYFQPKDQWALEQFIENFPKEIPLALEFRHEAWFQDFKIFEKMCNWLAKKGISTVITDVAGRRDVLHQRLTTPHLILRLVGNNLHKTDYERVNLWVEKIAQWSAEGLESAYLFIHEPDEVHCPEITTYLIQQLNKKLAIKLVPPKPIPQEVQGSLF